MSLSDAITESIIIPLWLLNAASLDVHPILISSTWAKTYSFNESQTNLSPLVTLNSIHMWIIYRIHWKDHMSNHYLLFTINQKFSRVWETSSINFGSINLWYHNNIFPLRVPIFLRGCVTSTIHNVYTTQCRYPYKVGHQNNQMLSILIQDLSFSPFLHVITFAINTIGKIPQGPVSKVWKAN